MRHDQSPCPFCMDLWNLLHKPLREMCTQDPIRDVGALQSRVSQAEGGRTQLETSGGEAGPCQALDLCKRSIMMSPALRVKVFISIREKIVLFSAFQMKRCSEIFLFSKLRLFKEELKLIMDQLVWLRGKGSTRGEEQ